MDDLRAQGEDRIRGIQADLSVEKRLWWVRRAMPHMPRYIQLQMAQPGSLLFVKYFSAAIFKEILPDFSILEQIQFFYWSFGPVALIGHLDGEAPKHFPFYEGTPSQNPTQNTHAIPVFMSLDGLSSEGKIAFAGPPVLKSAGILYHMIAFMIRNWGCHERLIEPVSFKMPDNSQPPTITLYRMESGYSEKILKRFRIGPDPDLSYSPSPPTTLRQVSWVPPPSWRFPAINGIEFPESVPLQPTFSKLPPELAYKILTRIRPSLQFKNVLFIAHVPRCPTPEYLEEPRLSYYDRDHDQFIHLPPLEVLFAQDTVPHVGAGGFAAAFLSSNTFNLTLGLRWLHHLPTQYLSHLRKVKLNLHLVKEADLYDDEQVRLVGLIASCANLEELILNLRLFSTKVSADLKRRFRQLPIFKHLSKIRGVTLVGNFEHGFLEEQEWLRECMSQPKEAGSMTSYAGMALFEDLQVHMQQEARRS